VERTAGLLFCCPDRVVADRVLVFLCEVVARDAPVWRPLVATADLDLLEDVADR
jgi:hypothetical protein